MQFELFTESPKVEDKVILDKLKTQKKPVKYNQFDIIRQNVNTVLGKYKEKYQSITDKEILHDYITECIGNGYISIDTETDGLDPLLNNLVGVCIYTPAMKGSYIPINHIGIISRQRIKNQIDMDFAREEFKRLYAKKPYVDMFNSKFDCRFLKNQMYVDAYCTWDSYIGSKLLNENENEGGLKPLYDKYVLRGNGDAYGYGNLFNGILFSEVPIDIAYIYASHDAYITYALGEYQRKFLREDTEREDLRKLYRIMMDVEMPCLRVVAEMEDNGISFDNSRREILDELYKQRLADKLQEVYNLIDNGAVEEYRAKKGINCKLDNPINIGSPSQLAILFYDILKYNSVDSKSPRGTGKEILEKLNTPLTNAIVEYKELAKLVDAFITKLPEYVNPKDNRIHCNYNTNGAKTGRMSCSNPNLQQVPSHNKDIRTIFVAGEGKVLISADFSSQEPKCLARLCEIMGDSQLLDVFRQGLDIYSKIASEAFNKPYEECREFNADGTTNKEGKERRSQAKKIVLGVLYGRGRESIAAQLGCTPEKAQDIKNQVLEAFPCIGKFERESKDMARHVGYVTTVMGRKRRLPDMLLDDFDFEYLDGIAPDNDLLDFTSKSEQTDVPQKVKNKYLSQLRKASKDNRYMIIQSARTNGIKITDNTALIARAERQCVNARVQGSASEITKMAMIYFGNNEKAKDYGCKLLLQIHDELIIETPIEYAKESADLLSEMMSKASEEVLGLSMKCDCTITKEWYGQEIKI